MPRTKPAPRTAKQHPENIFHKSADGPGLSRMQKAAAMKAEFCRIIQRSHPSARVDIDRVHEYQKKQIVMHRVATDTYVHYRLAVFELRGETWGKENDIIISQR
jgi:hypothetical protein